jgi:hypothetical protein
MSKVWDWLQGKKTNIGFTAAAIWGGLVAGGVIDPNAWYWATALAVITIWTGWSMRSAIAKSGPQ